MKKASSRWTSSAAPLRINCAACHAGADKGIFDAHRVKIAR
ncbi:hypothetical protein [Rhodoferax ferrireducens]|nr:hypothetical protein [Rhodoferax ferrireducens]